MAVAQPRDTAASTGKATQVIGPVVDDEVDSERLPDIYDPPEIDRARQGALVPAVQQNRGDDGLPPISVAATGRGGFSVGAGVGEGSREGRGLCGEMAESGVLGQTALVFGQMNEPPGARARVGLTGLTIAEYFRDEEGADVLLFIDNVFRYTLAGQEVSALLGRMPSAVGYQPTLGTEMGDLQERITSTHKGSITSVQAVYVPADDFTDPAVATTFAHLGATVSLSRAISEQGIYPAVDPLDSFSRILDPRVVGDEHYRVAQGIKRTLQQYRELQDIIAILGQQHLSQAQNPPAPPTRPIHPSL